MYSVSSESHNNGEYREVIDFIRQLGPQLASAEIKNVAVAAPFQVPANAVLPPIGAAVVGMFGITGSAKKTGAVLKNAAYALLNSALVDFFQNTIPAIDGKKIELACPKQQTPGDGNVAKYLVYDLVVTYVPAAAAPPAVPAAAVAAVVGAALPAVGGAAHAAAAVLAAAVPPVPPVPAVAAVAVNPSHYALFIRYIARAEPQFNPQFIYHYNKSLYIL
ncbi:hypothetical protein B484DRAFT_230439 [Ochromonadaceae sp. CCMP2298]|nr:hypothetical protein B484DRAFT_230439 [Ochromonadaceae sp. CCMP2298]